MNALEVAEALTRALGVRFGDVLLSVSGGAVTIVRSGHTLKPADLAAIEVHGVESEE